MSNMISRKTQLPDHDIRIRIISIRTAWILGATAVFLLAASTAGQLVKHYAHPRGFYQVIDLFYVDSEQNLPTYFSSLLLLIAALVLAAITILQFGKRTRYRYHWLILSLGFFTMSIDEMLSLHEKLVYPMQVMLGGGDLGIFEFAWIVPAMVFIGIASIFFAGFLYRLPSSTRSLFLIAGAIYISGVIGMEMLGGWYSEQHGLNNLGFKIMATFEECLEMTGIIIFIYALLAYVANAYREVTIEVN